MHLEKKNLDAALGYAGMNVECFWPTC